MKTALVIAAFLALLALSASTANGGQTTCGLSPNPVSLTTDSQFVVAAGGGIPSDFYEVTEHQAGHTFTDEDRVWLGQADASGTVTAQIGVADGRIETVPQLGALWPGTATVKVIHYQQGGKNTSKGASILATCALTVTG